ncbi:unnamed protein product [Hydatigera taeniaeformis]|uniref:Four helix bundle protein n=1 Tax=Hydatigena taeniaeformis TaxID=6205 RepID=A0A0R3X8D5_HYDTA|nr:unnamed protein product [Hydatigera taeniaeformis]
MEHLFDLSVTDKEAEIEAANREWMKRMREVAICGEREAINDGFNSRSSSIFDRGLDVGFEAVRDLAVLKGRLLFYKSMRNADGSLVDQLLSDLDLLMRQVTRAFAASRDHSPAFEAVFSKDLSEKIASTKEAVDKFLTMH